MLKPAVTTPGGLVHRGLSVAVGSLGFQMAIMQPGAANGNQTWKVPHVYPRAASLPIEHVIFNWRCQVGLWLVFGMIQQVM